MRFVIVDAPARCRYCAVRSFFPERDEWCVSVLVRGDTSAGWVLVCPDCAHLDFQIWLMFRHLVAA